MVGKIPGLTAAYILISAAIMIMTYGLWAFEIHQRSDSIWSVVSMVPFVICVLRYSVDVDSGNGGEPEEIVFRDHVLQVLALAWAVSLGLGYYPMTALWGS